MLTPPEIRTPRPASFEMLKVWRMGERGRGETGGETLDMPSGELLLLWIWERRGGREGERKEPDKQNIHYKGARRRRRRRGEGGEGGGGEKEEEEEEEEEEGRVGEGRRGVFHAGLHLVFTAYKTKVFAKLTTRM